MQRNQAFLQGQYEYLENLIRKRQENELKNPELLPKTDINFCDIAGFSLLHYAIIIGDLEKVKFLMEKGANINLSLPGTPSPIAVAIGEGNLEIAQFLFATGAACHDIHFHICNEPKTKEWLKTKITEVLYDIYPEPHYKYIFKSLTKNQFFFATSTPEQAIQIKNFNEALKRAAEIGDKDFINALLESPHKHYFYKNYTDKGLEGEILINKLLVIAARNGHIDLVQLLLMHHANINGTLPFMTTALIAAIENKQPEMIDFLLNQEIDLNKEDAYKANALFAAIINNNLELTKRLLEMGAHYNTTSLNGSNILHNAIACNHTRMVKLLLCLDNANELLAQKNIYGLTPLDLAVSAKSDECINLLSANSDNIKKSPAYGQLQTWIAQDILIPKIKYYLKINYRSLEFFYEKGLCNGFEFLFLYYASKKMQDYFFNTLEKIATWDGKNDTLFKDFGDAPQSKYYKNLAELFEQWISNIFWFQYAMNPPEQMNRSIQFPLLAPKNYNLNYIYKEYKLYNHPWGNVIVKNRTIPQLKEILQFYFKMPAGLNIELFSIDHVSGIHLFPNQFHHYDPNIRLKTEATHDVDHIVNNIVNYQYIFGEKFHNTINFGVRAFYFTENNQLNLEHFEIFTPQELPTSKITAKLFQQISPNEFTHMHVAILTHSLTSLKKLLHDGFCDIYAKDCLGRTILDMAIMSDCSEAIKLILQYTQLPPADMEHLVKIAYICGNQKTLKLLIDHFTINLTELFFQTIKLHDFETIKYLIKNNKVDMSTIFFSPTLTHHKEEIIITLKILMTQEKFDVTKDKDLLFNLLKLAVNFPDIEFFKLILDRCNKEIINMKLLDGNNLLINAIIRQDFPKIPLLIDYCYIDHQTVTGNTALMAVLNCKNYPHAISLIKLLLSYGARTDIKNNEGKTVLDLVATCDNDEIKKLFPVLVPLSANIGRKL